MKQPDPVALMEGKQRGIAGMLILTGEAYIRHSRHADRACDDWACR